MSKESSTSHTIERSFTINGESYNSEAEVPEKFKHLVKDENKDGVPDKFEHLVNQAEKFKQNMETKGAKKTSAQSQSASQFSQLKSVDPINYTSPKPTPTSSKINPIHALIFFSLGAIVGLLIAAFLN